MRNLTSSMQHGRDRLAIVLDGEVNSAPVVQATLSSIFVIEGVGDAEECKNLSATLMNPLENPLLIVKESTVTARLGAATVSQGIYAGIAGLALTLFIELPLLVYVMRGGQVPKTTVFDVPGEPGTR